MDKLPTYRVDDFLWDPSAPSHLDAADSWGETALTLDMPGGPYAFTGLDRVSQRQAIRRFSPVVSVSPTALPGALVTDVRRVAPGIFRPVQDALYAFELATSSRQDGIDLVGWRLVARLALTQGLRGILAVAHCEDLIGMGDLENYLRFLVAYNLLIRGGLLVHSACVVYREGAYLFVGRSGAGKTTISTLALRAGMSVLSDDLNALAPGTPPEVHKLPFAGTLGQQITATESYPLRAICWLAKGEPMRCAPMPIAQALSRLAVCAPYVNSDALRAEQLLESLENLVVNVPMLSVTFPYQADVQSMLAEIDAQAPRLG